MSLLAGAACHKPTPLTPETLCKPLAVARREFEVRCGTIDAANAVDAERYIENQCELARERRTWPGWSFDAELAQTCVDQWATRHCFASFAACMATREGPSPKYGWPQWCSTSVDTPQLPFDCLGFVYAQPSTAGAACDTLGGCDGGLACFGGGSSDLYDCGTCATPMPPPPPVCPAPTTCPPDACDAYAQACTPIPLGSPCGLKSSCGPSAYCRGLRWSPSIMFQSGVTLGVCAARLQTGAACTDEQLDDGCAEPRASCLNGICTVVQPFALDAGQACDAYDQCRDPLFCSGLDPDAPSQGTCAAYPSPATAPSARLGESCQGEWTCSEGVCLISTGVCAPALDDGAACTAPLGSECKHGLCVTPCPGGCTDGTPSRCLSACP